MLYQLLVLAQNDTPPVQPTPDLWEVLQRFWFLPVIFIIMYLLIIAPQRKKEKQRTEMRKSIKKNDKVVTIGGIHGVVKSLNENEVVIMVDESKDVKLRMSRQSVLTVKDRSDGDEPSELES